LKWRFVWRLDRGREEEEEEEWSEDSRFKGIMQDGIG
jgi:hypothetical protein